MILNGLERYKKKAIKILSCWWVSHFMLISTSSDFISIEHVLCYFLFFGRHRLLSCFWRRWSDRRLRHSRVYWVPLWAIVSSVWMAWIVFRAGYKKKTLIFNCLFVTFRTQLTNLVFNETGCVKVLQICSSDVKFWKFCVCLKNRNYLAFLNNFDFIRTKRPNYIDI